MSLGVVAIQASASLGHRGSWPPPPIFKQASATIIVPGSTGYAAAANLGNSGLATFGASATIHILEQTSVIAPLVKTIRIAGGLPTEAVVSSGKSSMALSRQYPPPTVPPSTPSRFPPWNKYATAPASALIGKSTGAYFDASELAALNAQFPQLLFVIHNGNSSPSNGIAAYFEDQAAIVASSYKTANPSGKFGLYVGFHGQRVGDYWYWQLPVMTSAPNYKNWLKGKAANADDPSFRDAWTTAIVTMLQQSAYSQFDGVLIDSFGPGFAQNKYLMGAELRTKLNAAGLSAKFIWANCAASLTPGATYFDGNCLDGCFNESIVGQPSKQGQNPVNIKQIVDSWIAFGKAGWPLIAKTFPGFTFVNQNASGTFIIQANNGQGSTGSGTLDFIFTAPGLPTVTVPVSVNSGDSANTITVNAIAAINNSAAVTGGSQFMQPVHVPPGGIGPQDHSITVSAIAPGTTGTNISIQVSGSVPGITTSPNAETYLAGPGSTWPPTYGGRVAAARTSYLFGLACNLVSTYKYTFFSTGWGYDYDGGAVLLQSDSYGNIVGDPGSVSALSTYAELLHRLGTPLGDATHPNGNQYQYYRQFQYGSVFVDLQQPNALPTITLT
jgi:hypothetical protein